MMKKRVFIALGIAYIASMPSVLAADACDIERGKSLWSKCAVCHTNAADADHSVGPNLFGIVDRPVAYSEDFLFSEEIKAYGERWTMDLLDKFLENPMAEVPGTTMAFAGFRKKEDRKNLLCFLAASEESSNGGHNK